MNLRLGLRTIACVSVGCLVDIGVRHALRKHRPIVDRERAGTGPLAYHVNCSRIPQLAPAVLVHEFNCHPPTISSRSVSGRWADKRRSYRNAVVVSPAIVAAVCAPIIEGARQILTVWLGSPVASDYHGVFVALIAERELVTSA